MSAGTGRRAALATALAFCALGVPAAEIATSIDGPAAEPREVLLVALRVDGAGAPVELTMTAPGTSHLALPEGLWEIRVASDLLWAAPIHVRNVDSAALRLLPATSLTGTSHGVTELRARFTSLDENGPSGEVACSVVRETWTCRLPHGRYDLQFFSRAMAPEFRSEVSIPSLQPPIALRFVAGASLYGWVEAARDARVAVEGAEVRLDGSGGRQTVRADRKGFFHIKALPPGDYQLSARLNGLMAQSRSVRILDGLAAELQEPLLLAPPKRLTVLVMPPLDPDGSAWRIRWSAAATEPHDAFEDRASDIGHWTLTGLAAGDYWISILDGRGGTWRSEPVTIGFEDVTLPVAASGMKIRGRVMLGERPLRASLSFGGEWGRVLQSDDDGRFAGEIPLADGEEQWIFVEADTPKVRLSLRRKVEEQELLLELPATSLMGRVVDGDGSPTPGAFITVSGRGASDVFEQVAAESDGTFQIAGLAPGAYDVVADAHERKSKPVSVDLKQDDPAEVEIVLEREELLRGKMTMGETPVVAATIFVVPRDAWGPTVPQTKTNERGMFQLRLPPGTTIFDGIAVHPAFDTVIARGTVRADRVAWVPANQIGGTLVVESQAPDDVLLLHKGAEVLARTVASLGSGVVAPDRVTLARLEPGEYSVCSRDRKACASGYLPPHGTLTLALRQ